MENHMGNYAEHAKFWNWSGHERTKEFEFWYEYAQKFGKNVLIPMCAWGETGAYMAEKGMTVTAFDVTPEMIVEGKKQFGNVKGLQLFESDIRDFRFDILPVDFCYCTDFGHLLNIEDVKKALVCINNHLRDGGCLVIETGLRLPDTKSFCTPEQTWHPFTQVYPGLKVWKTGITQYDADIGRTTISQIFYAEDNNGNMETFSHEFCLQSYTYEEWIFALKECGFDVANEYSNRELETWQKGSEGYLIFEAVKKSL